MLSFSSQKVKDCPGPILLCQNFCNSIHYMLPPSFVRDFTLIYEELLEFGPFA